MRIITVALLLLACIACEEGFREPNITINRSPVWVGIHAIGSSYHVDLQIENTGEKILKVERLEVKGDQRCAFEFKGPDIRELGEGEAGFIRATYKPQIEGYDNVALHVISNAEELPDFVVPVCGYGGSDPGGALPMCSAPPPEQPDCMLPPGN